CLQKGRVTVSSTRKQLCRTPETRIWRLCAKRKSSISEWSESGEHSTINFVKRWAREVQRSVSVVQVGNP
ncbi:hypothetical protein M513_11830, partial [Trichuris suis]